MTDPIDRRKAWQPRPRPQWLARVNEEGRVLDSRGIVPLDEASLLRSARENTGLDDFGDDEWREPFRILLKALEEEADLNLWGRIMTRSDLLIHLEGRLQITDWYRRHPEIDDEVILEPVFVTGLPRSGTTIMQEILGADPAARVVHMWEAKFPVPPPLPGESADPAYAEIDPRVARADALTTLQERITPEWAAMHKVGGNLPVECIEFTYSSFVSDAFSASFQVPSYSAYVAQADPAYAFWWHERVLKLLQSTGAPGHWLLKGPTHLPFLPQLFDRYPDARIVLMVRDPVKALASVVDVCGTLFWMRSDDPFSGDSYGHFLSVDPVVQTLDRLIDWLADGTIPADRVQPVRYVEFFADPAAQLQALYAGLGLPMTPEALAAMQAYLAQKPKGKFGEHDYETGGETLIAAERERFRRFQEHFGVPSEV